MNYLVQPNFVDEIWPTILPFVEPACALHPFLAPEDLLIVIKAQYYHLFISTDSQGMLGFAVLELVNFPRRKVANVLLAGGRRGFLQVATTSLYDHMRRWAGDQGCGAFTITTSRPGLGRIVRGGSFVKHELFLWREELGTCQAAVVSRP